MSDRNYSYRDNHNTSTTTQQTEQEMELLTKIEALELFDIGFQIYDYEFDTQPLQSRNEIEQTYGFLQTTKEIYSEYNRCKEIKYKNPDIQSLKEAKQYISKEDWYAIYQLKDNPISRDYRFMNYDYVQKNGFHINRGDYNFIYADKLTADDTLDSIYEKYNINHPADFKGHSLSVSDIVVTQREGIIQSFYVDSFGFKELSDFLLVKGLNLAILTEVAEKDNAYLEFYVAECQEFHDMGAYTDGLTLPEAVEKYKELREDPRNAYKGNGMGFIIHDQSLGMYDETEYPLINGSRIDGQMLDSIPELTRHPLIRQAIEELHETLPDYQYIPCKERQETYYPDIMDAHMIAAAVSKIYLSNASELHELYPNLNINEQDIYYDMLSGNQRDSINLINKVIDNIPSDQARAEALKDRIKYYEQEKVSDMEPVVKITFSEYKEIQPKYYPLNEIDQKVKELNQKFLKENDGPYQLRYTVCYALTDQVKSIEGRMNLGDSEDGIIDHLTSHTDQYLANTSWQNILQNENPELYKNTISNLADLQEHVLPYLQTFVSLPEKEPVEIMETKGAEQTPARKDIPKLEGKEKLSIHEKLELNKEILAQKNGSQEKEKSLEL